MTPYLVPITNLKDAQAACLAAAGAAPALAQAGRSAIVHLLSRIAVGLEGLGEPLVETVIEETSLSADRVRSERARTCTQLRSFAASVEEGSWVDATIDVAQLDRQPTPRPDVRRMLVPFGPVLVFGASNFPLAFSVAGGDTASALAAGCPVVVKAHPAHPRTSDLVARIVGGSVKEAGLPAGTFAMAHLPEPVDALELVRNPAIRAVAFTGSFRAGKSIIGAAARREHPVPVYAEMGSVNPLFVLPAALDNRGSIIGRELATSVTLGTGQFCTKPGLVFCVDSPAARVFIDALRDGLSAVVASAMLHEGIRNAYEDGCARRSKVAGIVLYRRSADSGLAAPHLLVIDTATYMTNPELADELFGPAVVVVRCKDHRELIMMARGTVGQLTATLHADEADQFLAEQLLPLLRDRAGRVVFNGFSTGVEVCAAMHHGGPWPATSDSKFTSVGTGAIRRFARPVCFQNAPAAFLPAALRDENPLGIWRMVNGGLTRGAVGKEQTA